MASSLTLFSLFLLLEWNMDNASFCHDKLLQRNLCLQSLSNDMYLFEMIVLHDVCIPFLNKEFFFYVELF